MTKTLVRLISIGLILIYIIPYVIFSRLSMYDNTLGGGRNTVWAFGPLVQQMDIYSDKESYGHKREKRLRAFYFPLIKLDKYILGNHHVLEKELPLKKS